MVEAFSVTTVAPVARIATSVTRASPLVTRAAKKPVAKKAAVKKKPVQPYPAIKRRGARV